MIYVHERCLEASSFSGVPTYYFKMNGGRRPNQGRTVFYPSHTHPFIKSLDGNKHIKHGSRPKCATSSLAWWWWRRWRMRVRSRRERRRRSSITASRRCTPRSASPPTAAPPPSQRRASRPSRPSSGSPWPRSCAWRHARWLRDQRDATTEIRLPLSPPPSRPSPWTRPTATRCSARCAGCAQT